MVNALAYQQCILEYYSREKNETKLLMLMLCWFKVFNNAVNCCHIIRQTMPFLQVLWRIFQLTTALLLSFDMPKSLPRNLNSFWKQWKKKEKRNIKLNLFFESKIPSINRRHGRHLMKNSSHLHTAYTIRVHLRSSTRLKSHSCNAIIQPIREMLHCSTNSTRPDHYSQSIQRHQCNSPIRQILTAKHLTYQAMEMVNCSKISQPNPYFSS